MYVVTIGHADLGEMKEWSRHRTLAAARKEAKKMSSIGHCGVAQNTPQLATVWDVEVWDHEDNGRPIESWKPTGESQ